MKYWDHSSEPVWVQPGPSFHMATSQTAWSEKLLAKMSFCKRKKKKKKKGSSSDFGAGVASAESRRTYYGPAAGCGETNL